MAETQAAAAQAADAGARVSDAELTELRARLERKTKDEEASRRRAEAAERDRDDAHRRVSSELDHRFLAEEHAIENGMAAAIADADRLEESIADLNEKGEYREATKKTRELASAQTRIDGYAYRQNQIQSVKERAKADAAERARDPLGQYGAPGSPTRRWIDEHPRFVSDDLYHDEVLIAHKRALRDGMRESSPEYFQFIEEAVGERQPVARAAPQSRAQQEAAAPLSEASDTVEAGDEIDIEDDEGVEVEPPEEGVDMYEEAVQQAQRRAPATPQRSERTRAKPAKTSSGAPPSRGAPPATRQPEGRVKLTRDEAERALADYPIGEYPNVKTEYDAYRLYHAEKQKLLAEGRIGNNVVR